MAALGLAAYALYTAYDMPLWQQIAIYPGTMFICCMICHGELVRVRPVAQHATLFYLLVSAGGALGGILVAIGAPLLLPDYWEYQIGLVATVALAFVAIALSQERVDRSWLFGGLGFALVAIAILVAPQAGGLGKNKKTVASARNFYGVLRVTDDIDPANSKNNWRLLTNGRINHGTHNHDLQWSRLPTTYYTAHSGVGLAIDLH